MKSLFFSLSVLLFLAGCATQEPVTIVEKTCREASCRGELEALKQTSGAALAACNAARRDAESRGRDAEEANQLLRRQMLEGQQQSERALMEKNAELSACVDKFDALQQTARDELAACNNACAERQAAVQKTLSLKDAEIAACRDDLETSRRSAKADLAACVAAREAEQNQAGQVLALRDAAIATCRGDLESMQRTTRDELAACDAAREKLLSQQEKVTAGSAKQIQRMKALEDNLRQRLHHEIADKDVEIDRLRAQLSVRVLNRILFDSGSADIRPQGLKVLDAVAEALEGGDETIRIEGHADTVRIGPSLRDKYATNWELSTGRASSVVRHFLDTHGIDPIRMEAVGFSKYRPVASNDTPEGRLRNRRVEIVLTPWKPLVEEGEP